MPHDWHDGLHAIPPSICAGKHVLFIRPHGNKGINKLEVRFIEDFWLPCITVQHCDVLEFLTKELSPCQIGFKKRDVKVAFPEETTEPHRSGWWLLLGLLPLLGGLVLLIFFIIGGTRGPNRFGPDPVEVGEGAT